MQYVFLEICYGCVIACMECLEGCPDACLPSTADCFYGAWRHDGSGAAVVGGCRNCSDYCFNFQVRRKNNEKNMQNNIGCRIDGLYDDAGRKCNGSRQHRRKLAGCEAGVGFAKISASLVGLDGICININEDNTADIIFAVDGDETKAVKNVKIEEKEGEKYFDVKIPDADSPSLSEGQKKLAEIAEKFGLEGFGNIAVDDDGRLKIQAEFENFDADLYLSRIEEQPYLHCWDRLPSEFPEK